MQNGEGNGEVIGEGNGEVNCEEAGVGRTSSRAAPIGWSAGWGATRTSPFTGECRSSQPSRVADPGS